MEHRIRRRIVTTKSSASTRSSSERPACTYNILMGVHEDIEIVLLRDAQDLDSIRNPFIVVLSWPRVLDSLPSKNISDRIVTPFAQSAEMERSFL